MNAFADAFMPSWIVHLPVLPIVVPLVAGAAMLFVRDSRRALKIGIGVVATALQLAAALLLVHMTSDMVQSLWTQGIGVYAIGDWPAPFGIVLVVDRLSALMLLLTSVLALPVLIYSVARWDRIGVHFHPLFQFLLAGLNGAFLTGDLFSLFVFFEVLLAASYGLLLHGSGATRVKSGLHYVVVNLGASLLFLIGVAVIYGVTGTLNMADLVSRAAELDDGGRRLFEAGIAILGIAFLVKAGSWPLNFWLATAYAAASAPVAAIFSIMTKVGVYAVLRLGSLLEDGGAPAPLGGEWLFGAGLATMAFGIIGMLAAQQLGRLVAYVVIVSSGTVLAAVGLASEALLAPALFYLLTSVLGTGAFFLLTGMTRRTRTGGAEAMLPLPASDTLYGYEPFDVAESPREPGVDDEIGIAIPAAMAFLGLTFVFCALLVTGLPPLAGFLAKFAILAATLRTAPVDELPVEAWALVVTLLATGIAGLIALTRAGMRLFWSPVTRRTPRLRVVEAAPVAFLVLACVGLTVAAGPVMSFLDATAALLRRPHIYVEAVLPPPAPLPELAP